MYRLNPAAGEVIKVVHSLCGRTALDKIQLLAAGILYSNAPRRLLVIGMWGLNQLSVRLRVIIGFEAVWIGS